MRKNPEERRAYSRLKTNLKIAVSEDKSGDTVDISEGGLSFTSGDTIASPVISIRIRFPDKTVEFKEKARLAWRRDLQEGESAFGVEFIRLNEKEKAALREGLIKAQISGLLSDIKSAEIRSSVSDFFLKDLLDYTNEMDRLMMRIADEERYSIELEKKIDDLNNKILLKGYSLELLLVDRVIIRRVKNSFRRLVDAWLYKSLIVKRAFDKPRGYSEDYKTLEFIYDNEPISKNIGLYFDNIFLKSPYAVAARARKDRLRDLIYAFINESEAHRIRILNVACSSSREIRELLPLLKNRRDMVFTCIDWDEEALQYSRNSLVGEATPGVKFKFLQAKGAAIEENKKLLKPYEKQNLIYSIGLIDYLPDRILKKLIQVLYDYLEHNGKLILTHKNREITIPPICPDWFCNWTFVQRSKNDMIKLFYDSGISRFSLLFESDAYGYIYFFIVSKK